MCRQRGNNERHPKHKSLRFNLALVIYFLSCTVTFKCFLNSSKEVAVGCFGARLCLHVFHLIYIVQKLITNLEKQDKVLWTIY